MYTVHNDLVKEINISDSSIFKNFKIKSWLQYLTPIYYPLCFMLFPIILSHFPPPPRRESAHLCTVSNGLGQYIEHPLYTMDSTYNSSP